MQYLFRYNFLIKIKNNNLNFITLKTFIFAIFKFFFKKIIDLEFNKICFYNFIPIY